MKYGAAPKFLKYGKIPHLRPTAGPAVSEAILIRFSAIHTPEQLAAHIEQAIVRLCKHQIYGVADPRLKFVFLGRADLAQGSMERRTDPHTSAALL